MSDPEVLIVGAGLAGLTCARHLHREGVPCQIFEASDDVGGRIRTDEVDGYKLDRGFQVLLTAYPEAQLQLDYDALDLHAFYDGALVRFDGRFHRLADPFRHPRDAPGTIFSPIGTFTDKLRVAKLRTTVTDCPLDELFERDETTTEEALRNRYHFSENIIDRFFRPFFGGIFLDANLGASSRVFDFLYRMFALGQATLPADGIQAIPRQVAADLPENAIRLNTRVAALGDDGTATLDAGETLRARAVVVAAEAPAANRLLSDGTPTAHRSTTCLYYAAEEPPFDDPILVLNGNGEGPINNINLLSNAAPTYAPGGRALLSVTVLGDPDVEDKKLESRVRRQLAEWFGPEVGTWTHLRTYRVRYALPDQAPPFLASPAPSARRRAGLYVCGDYQATGSINGALASGRRAAEAVLEDLG